jgi:polyhydroxybutyrate depolymerase
LNFKVDEERIYVTGMSNGGFMSHRVACEMSDVIAAAAPVAGVLMESEATRLLSGKSDPFTCKPTKPVPILQMHNELDVFVPYPGNPFLGFPSVDDTVEKWAKINGVLDTEQVVVYDDRAETHFTQTQTICTSYAPETSNTVSVCRMRTGALVFVHCWPGQGLGQCSDKLGNEHIWDFFSNYTLSGFVGKEESHPPHSSENSHSGDL